MSDRDVQDDVIRALADAGFRRSDAWLERRRAPQERVERFARFLARRFYHQRVVHFFKYSRALAKVTERRPEEALRTRAFESLLPEAVLGSRATAARVASVVVAFLRGAPGAEHILYLDDLLRYEEAMMDAEAGPREWGEAPPEDAGVASLTEGTRVLELSHDLPAVLSALLRPWDELPQAPATPTRLLIARSRHGRVSVVVATDAIARLLELADGSRSAEELASAAGVEPEALDGMLRELVDLGAIRLSGGS